LTRCTIAGNAVTLDGGGFYCHRSPSQLPDEKPTLTACIVWDNVGPAITSFQDRPVVRYSCIEHETVARPC
jgi:hypothetical protein